MILQLRPLGISLVLHLIVFGFFLFWFTGDRVKQASKPLKINIASFVAPSVQTPSPRVPTPLPAVPLKQTIAPIQKSTSLPPVVTKSLPTKIAPAPMVTPPVTTSKIEPISVQVPAIIAVETPKTPMAAPTPPSPPVNVEKEFLNAHLGEIRGLLLQNLKYPKMAQKLKMQGEVRVYFSLSSDGSVDDIRVVESSGFELLDEDAKALIEKMASRFPKPTKSVRINVPVSYVLH